MGMYLLILGIQGLLAFTQGVAGPSAIEYAILPPFVAGYAAVGRWRFALCLVAMTLLAASASSRYFALAGYFAGVSALGLITGWGIARGVSYGRLWAAKAGISIAVMTPLLIWAIPGLWMGEAAKAHANFVEIMRSAADTDQDAATTQLVERARWVLIDHWTDVGLGLSVWLVLLLTAAGVSLARKHAARLGVKTGAMPGSFDRARTPDWMVWLAIASALLFMADRWRPELGLRPIAWNACIAMACVYWMNGMSIAAYSLRRLNQGLMAANLLLLALFLCVGPYMLCFIGLADTWADFRRGLEKARLLALRFRRKLEKDDADE